MQSLMDHVNQGGFGMYPTMVFGFALLFVALKYAAAPAKRWVPLLFGLGIVTLTSGGLGFVTGLIATAGSVVGKDVGTAIELRIGIEGFAESLNNVALALVFLVMGSLAASVGALKIAKTETLPEA